MTIFPVPARAGAWNLVYTASGTETTKPTDPSPSNTFSDTNTGINTVTGTKAFSAGFNQPGGASTSITVNVSVTGTWVPDPSLPSDPAPPSVKVIETASIFQGGFNGDGTLPSGAADDGLGDASVVTSDGQGHTERLSATPTNTVPVQHLSTQTGNSFTLSHTLKANSTAAAYTYHDTDATAKFVSYTVSVHAQPYNYAKVPGGGNMGYDGSLSFAYDWLSTTGNKNDLTTCYWHEYVSYSGTAGTAADPTLYSPPNPPFSFVAYPNPTVSPGTGTNGGAMTGTNQVVDTQGVPPFVPPSLYTYGTFTAAQVYEFDDTATGETNVKIPEPDSGLFSIVREFKLNDAHDYIYTCTKDNHTASVLKPF